MWLFIFNSILLGVGLAMDAFSVSLANGLNEPNMRRSKMCAIAGVFAAFQALMPMAGWVCVHTVVEHFRAFETFIPWIALALLGYIGGKMVWEAVHESGEEGDHGGVGFKALMVQGVATSIDALSVGFTIAEYPLPMALVSALLLLSGCAMFPEEEESLAPPLIEPTEITYETEETTGTIPLRLQ